MTQLSYLYLPVSSTFIGIYFLNISICLFEGGFAFQIRSRSDKSKSQIKLLETVTL